MCYLIMPLSHISPAPWNLRGRFPVNYRQYSVESLCLVLDHLQSIPIILGRPDVTSLAADVDTAAYHILLRQKVALAVTAQPGASDSSARTC